MKQFRLLLTVLALSTLLLKVSVISAASSIEVIEAIETASSIEVIEAIETASSIEVIEATSIASSDTLNSEKLNILWTTDNKNTSKNMIAMYSNASMRVGWWREINIIVWGGSAKLIKEDPEMQELVKEMIANGIHIEACEACASKFKAVETLKGLGIEVKMMGKPLTDYIKRGEHILTL